MMISGFLFMICRVHQNVILPGHIQLESTNRLQQYPRPWSRTNIFLTSPLSPFAVQSVCKIKYSNRNHVLFLRLHNNPYTFNLFLHLSYPFQFAYYYDSEARATSNAISRTHGSGNMYRGCCLFLAHRHLARVHEMRPARFIKRSSILIY